MDTVGFGTNVSSTGTSKNTRNYRVNVDDLVDFLFPNSQQHPLVSGRLYAFGECGPLDDQGHLRSGFQGKHVVMDYELDEMCMQYEREDIIQIYLHRASDMGSLSMAEEEAIIGQADAHLKRAKGKAMLPRLTKDDVYAIFQHLPRDECGTISFHEAQRAITEFRRDRIKRYKLVFPNLTTTSTAMSASATTATTTVNAMATNGMKTSLPTKKQQTNKKLSYRVSEDVAPVTMFQKMKGNTNSDLIEHTTKLLSTNAYKLADYIHPSMETDTDHYHTPATAADLAANARLLRKPDPRRATQRLQDSVTAMTLANNSSSIGGSDSKNSNGTFQRSAVVKDSVPYWNNTCTVRGTGMGSMVDAVPSSSTWKRNSTIY